MTETGTHIVYQRIEDVFGTDYYCRYTIQDVNGELRWFYRGRDKEPLPGIPTRRLQSVRTGYVVTEEEAEFITGLLPPACFDRLRDLM